MVSRGASSISVLLTQHTCSYSMKFCLLLVGCTTVYKSCHPASGDDICVHVLVSKRPKLSKGFSCFSSLFTCLYCTYELLFYFMVSLDHGFNLQIKLKKKEI